MQLSRFVLTYRDVRPGEHVLYDVVSDQYVGVDDMVLASLDRWRNEPAASNEEREVQDVLRQQEILVDGEAQDGNRLRAFLEKASEGIPGTMYVTLMPTLKCNLACTYCFQKDHPAFTRMKEPTEDATVEFILRKVDAAASRRLKVHYFGGEPLTRKDFLLRTAEVFSAAMTARAAEFEWEITTNGIGLDLGFVRAMRAQGPGSIKVTLDGDKETHDAARVYRDGRGSFDEIYTRTIELVRACPDVKFNIGGNFLPHQVPSYERLLDRLEADGMKGLFGRVHFKPIIDTNDKNGTSCTSCASRAEEADSYVQLQASVERRQLAKPGTRHMTPAGPCELHWKHSYVIDPEGHVYKCPAVAGRPELAVASVRSKAAERQAPLLELRPWEQCGPCPYLPVCVGGCLGGQYLQTGRRDEVFCKKSQFEKSFREEVVGRYLAEFTEADSSNTA